MSLRFAEANETYQRAFDLWRHRSRSPAADRDAAGRHELPAQRPRPAVGDRVAQHPALHAAVRPAGRAVAGAHDRAVARRAVGDRRRRPAIRVPSPRGPDVVGREPLTAHDVEFGIKRVLNPDAPGSSVAIYFVLENGQDYYLRHHGGPGSDRRAGARRSDRRVPARGAGAVLHERDEPPRRRAAAAARDRARRAMRGRRPGNRWSADRSGSPNARRTGSSSAPEEPGYAAARATSRRVEYVRRRDRRRDRRLRARRAGPDRGAVHAADWPISSRAMRGRRGRGRGLVGIPRVRPRGSR